MKRTIFVALLLASGAAYAARWISIGTGGNGDRIFIDVSTIQLAGNIRHVWWEQVYLPHTDKGVGDEEGKGRTETVRRSALNCNERSQKIEAQITYFEDGTNYVEPSRSISEEVWEPVPPDSILERVMKAVCAVSAGALQ